MFCDALAFPSLELKFRNPKLIYLQRHWFPLKAHKKSAAERSIVSQYIKYCPNDSA